MNISRLALSGALIAVIAQPSLANSKWIIRMDGAGAVKIGMTLPELNAALHEKFSMPRNKEDQSCFYVRPAAEEHIQLMIEDGRLVRIDVDAPGISTAEGIQIGDSESRARQVYGAKMKVEPSQYGRPKDHYLTVLSTDRHYGMRFESDNGKISMFYAGKSEAIQYVEGCE